MANFWNRKAWLKAQFHHRYAIFKEPALAAEITSKNTGREWYTNDIESLQSTKGYDSVNSHPTLSDKV